MMIDPLVLFIDTRNIPDTAFGVWRVSQYRKKVESWLK